MPTPKRRSATLKTHLGGKIPKLPDDQRLQLLHGPYTPPATRVGKPITCVLRGKANVCGWSNGPIPWPVIRAGHGGKGAYAVTPELARAVRCESSAAIMHQWGVGLVTVTRWRKALGVEQFNEGTRKLWSLWKEPKLPDHCVAFSKGALRERRLTKGMTQTEVAKRMGWNSVNSYGQMETGGRWRSTRKTLDRLAKVFGCRTDDLIIASAQ